ncbi:MAG: hypothetical protein ABGY75_19005, partial [Gemmataceae bacterium]
KMATEVEGAKEFKDAIAAKEGVLSRFADRNQWRELSDSGDELIAAASGGIPETANNAGEVAGFNRVLEKYSADVNAVQEAMLKHLTADQRAKWKQMTGDPLPRLDLMRAGTAFGDARVVKVVTEADAAAQPAPPPQVLPAGGVVPVAPPGVMPPALPPQLQPPPPPPPVEKK